MDDVPVSRTLTQFDNETERLVAEYPLRSFDLENFKQHFGVVDEYDVLMYNVYPVTRDDIGFVSKYLEREVVFDFDKYTYYVECFSSER